MSAPDYKAALKEKTGGVVILLHVLPNAKNTHLLGLHNGAVKLKVKAPPIDGKANQEIVRYFSQILAVNKSKCEILKGDKSKTKQIFIADLTAAVVNSHLQQNSN